MASAPAPATLALGPITTALPEAVLAALPITMELLPEAVANGPMAVAFVPEATESPRIELVWTYLMPLPLLMLLTVFCRLVMLPSAVVTRPVTPVMLVAL